MSTKSKSFLLAGLLVLALRSTAQVPPAINTQPSSPTVNTGGTATFTVAVSGDGPFRYQWRHNGTNLFLNGQIDKLIEAGPYAADTPFYHVQGVTTDNEGNLYIADTGDVAVWKGASAGSVGVVAGLYIGPVQSTGFSGDGGPATAARLDTPTSVAVDGDGNIYIADFGNNRVRKVDAQGIITTFAGNGAGAFGGDGGAATNASLNRPIGVTADNFGNVFIADLLNNRVRKVDANGIITTVAGNGKQGFSGEGGKAADAGLNYPSGVAVDSAGSLYISDSGDNRIRKVNADGTILTIAGSGGPANGSGDGGMATSANLNSPGGIALDSFGNLFIADFYNSRVREVTPNGIIMTVAGTGQAGFSGDGGLAAHASLNDPYDVALDVTGDLLIADYKNNCIRRVSGAGPTLVISNAAAADLGGYDVIIANGYGSVTSSVASITLTGAPVIGSQPQNLTAAIGSEASFSVTAYGSAPLKRQWLASTAADTATASSVLVNGFVVSATVTGGGAGYVTAPSVQIVGGGGSGATAAASVVDGQVTGVQINTAGSDYTSAPNIVIAPPPARPLAGQIYSDLWLAPVSPGDAGDYFIVVSNRYGSVTSSIATLTVILQPAITAEPVGRLVPAGGSATISVTAAGGGTLGYQWFASPAQNAARAIPQVLNGFVVGATVSSSGAGYGSPPQVNIAGGGGAGASATASVTDGSVTAVNIVNAGAGYTSAPSVEIAPPPAGALPGQTSPTLNLSSITLGQAGPYYVVVTNAYGSVTSSVAVLSVELPPLAVNLTGTTGLHLGFSGLPGVSYILETTTNLSPPVFWQSAFTNAADSIGKWNFADTNTANYPARYYRVVGR